ncbi:Glycosyl transferase family 2 [Butyrivibrio hungatei DSM 14810]|uniref:Glycosyl transferase family 2 n=1 Tax=Butyrivibrio hungatei DSM 14810 TaxID=1121132 RepID=A0A1M7T5L5_9FIRM|nr:glycosyltransferase family 2 protein [Butyrivibrio hungatei]SHN65892.1 Glycosyl transferase family 2 [Butyrivibrio hungatei DSM 14810]
MTIDVIVPIYNVEKYIDKCIRSILEQEYSELHVILIDDGSTDASGKICDEYAKKDKRIEVVHKKNGGLSDARNTGLKLSRNELIAFIDGDDFIHPSYLKKMMSVMENYNADVVVTGVEKISEEHIVAFDKETCSRADVVVIEKKDILKQLVERDELTVIQCNKLFKKEILNGIEFPVGRKHEDTFVIHEQLYKCNRIAYIEESLYYYVQRSGSIMHSEGIESILDAIDALVARIEFLKEHSCNSDLQWASNMLFKYIMWKYEEAVECKDTDKKTVLSKKYTEYYKHYYKLTFGLSNDYVVFAIIPSFFGCWIEVEKTLKRIYAKLLSIMKK